ncbi:MAG: RNA polymerase sigma factor [Planctomycetota bacterium]|nr:RNA polymerase sigma factor [Planctomycetota bacterium]
MPSGLDLDQLVREHQADLWWYLRTLGCDAATAEDLTQECFVALMQSDFEARHPRATFGYLRTSARHRYISLLRKQKRDIEIDVDEIDALWTRFRPDERLEALKEALGHCLMELTDRARETVLLRFQQGKKTNEIAAATNAQPAAVTKLLQRAKHALKACLERRVPE